MRPRALTALPALLALSACAAGPAPKVETPPPVLPQVFLLAPDEATAASLAALLPSDDPAFRVLSERAMAGAPTLGEALARIEQARAAANRAGAERAPDIGVNGSVTGTRSNPAQFAQNLPPGMAFDSERIAYAANVTARWDLDLFGRLRAQERAALARIDAAEAAARGVRIALVSEIAASVIDWRTLQARQAALEQDLASARRLAYLSLVRERAGIAPGFDRVRAQALADASGSRLAALESERSRLIGRLVTLTASDAAAVRDALGQSAGAARALPPAPASAPSALLVNRPDVIAAEAGLRAADAELAATARRRFPTFSLSAAVGLLSFGLGDLFASGSAVGSHAASVAAPLIDFGRIAAEIEGAAAGKKAAFESYRRAVYTALGDAEAAYGLIAGADREAEATLREAASQDRAARIAEERHRAGLASFLTVLDARRTADASSERAAAALGRAQRARVLLWQSLGGSDI
jgi:NodT family efflux transporter outer membrane factor (OMF) lipoprotein